MLLREEDEEVKIVFTCISYVPHVIFSSNFWHAVTFLHVLHLDILRRQIEIDTESKDKNFLMFGYNAGPPMANPIYTVLPYCVITGSGDHEWWIVYKLIFAIVLSHSTVVLCT